MELNNALDGDPCSSVSCNDGQRILAEEMSTLLSESESYERLSDQNTANRIKASYRLKRSRLSFKKTSGKGSFETVLLSNISNVILASYLS